MSRTASSPLVSPRASLVSFHFEQKITLTLHFHPIMSYFTCLTGLLLYLFLKRDWFNLMPAWIGCTSNNLSQCTDWPVVCIGHIRLSNNMIEWANRVTSHTCCVIRYIKLSNNYETFQLLCLHPIEDAFAFKNLLLFTDWLVDNIRHINCLMTSLSKPIQLFKWHHVSSRNWTKCNKLIIHIHPSMSFRQLNMSNLSLQGCINKYSLNP